jgi:hypothetical protein
LRLFPTYRDFFLLSSGAFCSLSALRSPSPMSAMALRDLGDQVTAELQDQLRRCERDLRDLGDLGDLGGVDAAVGAARACARKQLELQIVDLMAALGQFPEFTAPPRPSGEAHEEDPPVGTRCEAEDGQGAEQDDGEDDATSLSSEPPWGDDEDVIAGPRECLPRESDGGESD